MPHRVLKRLLASAALVGAVTLAAPSATIGAPVDSGAITIDGPDGSSEFGRAASVLTNGNYVVTDPGWPDATEVGAVYLYDGTDNTVISTLTGSQSGDRVGSGAVIEVGDSNFVVASPNWNFAAVNDAGAATWIDGSIGLNGVVGSGNSVHGGTPQDGPLTRLTALTNGNYLVSNSRWDLGGATDSGGVVWGDGDSGIRGQISSANALHGLSDVDWVGINGVHPLLDGNYVVNSSRMGFAGINESGAVTWGDGSNGTTGPITTANSLHGTQAGDQVGGRGLSQLTGGGYVINSPLWDNGSITDAGAATWAPPGGVTGPVTTSNSLHGTQPEEQVGFTSTPLADGHYVVGSPGWRLGTVENAGAVTWANGVTGRTGPVTAANSLHGTHENDFVGQPITSLSNGDFVVSSRWWDNGTIRDAGAVTWSSGTNPLTGPISTDNSLHGTATDHEVGAKVSGPPVVELTSGHYVVLSEFWDLPGQGWVGAVTWSNADGSTTGPVTTENSLHGTRQSDLVGGQEGGVVALANGNFVVASPRWRNGSVSAAGAVTWAAGDGSTVGAVTTANSLHGSQSDDDVGAVFDSEQGELGVRALTNGNYVVMSSHWRNETIARAGAVTWGDGLRAMSGPVSVANSLVGTTPHPLLAGIDYIGTTVLADGSYVVNNALVEPGHLDDATWADGESPTAGTISDSPSLRSVEDTSAGRAVVNPTAAGAILLRSGRNVITLLTPAPTITAGPDALTDSGTATFEFEPLYPGATLACSIDGAPGEPCTSPFRTPTLADGMHTFTVSTVGGSAAPNRDWEIDTTGPVATVGLAVGQNANVTATPVVFTVTFDEPVTGFDPGDLIITGTAGATLADSTFTGAGAAYSVTINRVPNPGTMTLGFNADNRDVRDSLGNIATRSATGPTVTITDAVGPTLVVPADVQVDTELDATIATVTYTVTATDPDSSASSFAGAVTINCTPPSGSQFPIGTTAVTCTATDTSGNTTTASFNVTVNAQTSPTTTTTTLPATTTTAPATAPADTAVTSTTTTVAPPMSVDPNVVLPATGNSDGGLRTTLLLALLLTCTGITIVRSTRRRV